MKNTILLFALTFLIACQSTENQERGYVVKTDEFKQTARYSIVPTGSLDGTPFLSKSEVYIDIFADKSLDNMATTIAVILQFESWAFINPGESLIMIADGERLVFRSPNGSSFNRTTLGGMYASLGVFVREEAHYPITVEQIKKLAQAKDIKVAVYGSKQSVERQMNEDHIESIRNFYEKFILANGIVSV